PKAGLPGPTAPATHRGITVNRLTKQFLHNCRTYYIDPAGAPPREVANMKGARMLLKQQFGPSRAQDFGPLKLKRLREAMICRGWCRKTVTRTPAGSS